MERGTRTSSKRWSRTPIGKWDQLILPSGNDLGKVRVCSALLRSAKLANT